MKTKSFSGKTFAITLLLVGFGWAVYAIAAPVPQANQKAQASGFSYAQLTLLGENQVTWDAGGNEVPRNRSISAVYRDLGGSSRVTEINLMNSIGQNGWELVQVDGNVWTFKRSN